MPYDYQKIRPFVFTEEGVDKVMKIQDRFNECFEFSGAVMYFDLTKGLTGDSWEILSCVDYLEEKGRIYCATPDWVTQHRIYTLPPAKLMGV